MLFCPLRWVGPNFCCFVHHVVLPWLERVMEFVKDKNGKKCCLTACEKFQTYLKQHVCFVSFTLHQSQLFDPSVAVDVQGKPLKKSSVMTYLAFDLWSALWIYFKIMKEKIKSLTFPEWNHANVKTNAQSSFETKFLFSYLILTL